MDSATSTAELIARTQLIEEAFRRNEQLARKLVDVIHSRFREATRVLGVDRLKIMDFCGTHEWTIVHFGLRSLMPDGLELVAGPGCPVCVTPSRYIEEAIRLALDGVRVYTYGDTFKLRTINEVRGFYSLEEARSRGADVKMVTGLPDAVRDARRHGKDSLFLGIGFETVAPGYAQAVLSGHVPENLKLLSLVKLTPPAMFYSLDILREKPPEPPVMGVIAPGHVSTITGAKAWEPVAENYSIPVVVSGFEPIDVLASIAEILSQLARREARVRIEYTRAVTWAGDLKAQAMIHKAFYAVDDAWRGIGFLPLSGLRLREAFSSLDAFKQFGIPELKPEDWRKDTPPGCRCAEVTLGKAKPTDCPMFLKKCTPEKPYGPCMVSLEGTCAVWARFGGGGVADDIARELGLK
ncbi:hydrogenase formation protein HypD [Infirmifilum sp. NZ]|uniref:hydrogenase formation protein HypD n=1 Tax=Infirmifilum sp. NZ TaxID=2926850 RepID=UPI0027989A07|nr:hydrogenase formation protein HypD [Infirmifilum sp. NZ]UNQ73836.1 hydrogenase formation protein HypD [Infirmifilum sp. NZ]